MRSYFIQILIFATIILLVLLPIKQNYSIRKYILGPTEVHKTIYVSNDFGLDDMTLIEEAASEWKLETNGIVSFTIIYGFDGALYNSLNNKSDSMVMTRAMIDDFIINHLDKNVHSMVLGYFLTEFGVQNILLVPGRMLGDSYYRAVIIHEMGHSIGLPHMDEDDTIMAPSMDRSAYHLSKKDMDWMCRVYYCDSEKLGGN